MTIAQHDTPINVTTIGMEQRMRNSIQLFFKIHCKNRCVMVEKDHADIGIIDLDGYGASKLEDEYRKNNQGQPVILISVNDIDSKGDIFLKKPLKAADLLAAIERIVARAPFLVVQASTNDAPVHPVKAKTDPAEPAGNAAANRMYIARRRPRVDQSKQRSKSLHTYNAASLLEDSAAKALIGTLSDIDPMDASQVARIQYNPEDFIYGHFQRAAIYAEQKKTNLRIETPSGQFIYLWKTQQVVSPIDNTHLRTLSSVPISRDSIKIAALEPDRFTAGDGDHVLSKESFLWQAALWAARGRIPNGTDLTLKISLRRWPNLTRLMLFPNAIRIAALWTDRPYTLVETSRILGIPQRFVFAFYNAAQATGLTNISQQARLSVQEPVSVKIEERRSLLGKVMRHLRLKRDTQMFSMA